MYLAQIYVTHKPSILDPQGEAVKNALHRLNYTSIESISQGKFFEVTINADSKDEAVKTIESICKDLLVNQNMETYSYEIKEG
ncbi:phosphoribosylformylglycinamidine synthase subunit PurS [Nicoliella lavandulae]|uniref:Phosphoribosylformylglycinamidine synthase subunit PurS n=1 Tax=Nicoliella lavandulae TaxID=3082954 RepID=A0ABU8SKM2_9LACO